MFARVAALATLASLFVFAAAAPAATSGQCNGGEIYCCNSTQEVEKMDGNYKSFNRWAHQRQGRCPDWHDWFQLLSYWCRLHWR
ncbi:hypothetical protein NMY22_g4148 [Coprinellus aureogranulatus]|nr:hypothetical protein NMY22_g4148 [Coprinellus aureogranulatus]